MRINTKKNVIITSICIIDMLDTKGSNVYYPNCSLYDFLNNPDNKYPVMLLKYCLFGKSGDLKITSADNKLSVVDIWFNVDGVAVSASRMPSQYHIEYGVRKRMKECLTFLNGNEYHYWQSEKQFRKLIENVLGIVE